MKRNLHLLPGKISDITFDVATGKILEVNKNGRIYKGQVGFIESQRDYILDCIQAGVTPSLDNARWDVAFYNFMLNADEPDKRIDQYFDKKAEIKSFCKKEIAKALGWEILLQ